MIHNYTKGLIDCYAKRARNLSLADLVAWYDLRGKPKNKKNRYAYRTCGLLQRSKPRQSKLQW